MNRKKLAVELLSIADDVMGNSRVERTTAELGLGLANWVKAYNLLKTYGNAQASGVLRGEINKVVKEKDLDTNMVWNGTL
jgi:hypothetical protein